MHFRLEQTRLLTRGPVGTAIEVRFVNPGSDRVQTSTFRAEDDGGQDFSLLDFAVRPDFSDKVDWEILPGKIGYIRLRLLAQVADMSLYPSAIRAELDKAMQAFLDAQALGVILDLRGNYGGADQLAVDICGYFYSLDTFYEYVDCYDKRDGSYQRMMEYTIKPHGPHFSGPLAVLANPGSLSSAEGPSSFLSRLPQARLVGFHGSNGSFGLVGTDIQLPGGYLIHYPFGRSVDASGTIQLDSRNGVGGLAPTLRVPKTQQNVLDYAAGVDVEKAYAIGFLQGK